ncbi:MAG: hypothetical protein V3R93_06205 [Candidatus Hydrothermarchaeaceae archaeon]
MALLLSSVVTVDATPENAEKAGKDCNYCHPDGPPVLGGAGLYFQEHHTLEGFGEIGVHLNPWDIAIICFSVILLVVVIVHLSRV